MSRGNDAGEKARAHHAGSVAVLLLLVASAAFGQVPDRRIARPAYPLAILIGFGSGHFYLGANGWPFLIADAAGIGGMGAGVLVLFGSIQAHGDVAYPSPPGAQAGVGLWLLGSIVLVVSRIWEIEDIFQAVREATRAGTVVEAAPAPVVRPTSITNVPPVAPDGPGSAFP